jgi:Tfp pilus assembly protein PilW
MSLPELLIGLGIGALALTAVCTLFVFQARSNASLANYIDLDIKSRNALDRISRDIRQSSRLVSYTSGRKLVFETISPTTGATGRVAFVYSPDAATLTRTNSGEANIVLLKNIKPNSFNFSLFQRNPVGGVVDQYPTTDTASCKAVQLSWVCAKTIFGKTNNTECVQSAKIVIRKE